MHPTFFFALTRSLDMSCNITRSPGTHSSSERTHHVGAKREGAYSRHMRSYCRCLRGAWGCVGTSLACCVLPPNLETASSVVCPWLGWTFSSDSTAGCCANDRYFRLRRLPRALCGPLSPQQRNEHRTPLAVVVSSLCSQPPVFFFAAPFSFSPSLSLIFPLFSITSVVVDALRS